jgi:ankyrin repeat protein
MEVLKINVVAPDEVRILPIIEEAPGKKSISINGISSSSSLKRSFAAGQRRLRTETQLNSNLALFHSQESISPEALDAIIKYGKNPYNWSPLNYAIAVTDWKAAGALIDAGIGINTKNGHVGSDYTPIIRLLELAGHGHLPYRENATILLRKIILKGIDISLPMECGLTQGQYVLGGTALFYCAPHLNAELELFLTTYKVNPNFLPATYSMGPMQLALQFPYIDTVKTLLKYGAKVNEIDCFSRLGLMGTSVQTKEMISLLISNGANPLRVSNVDSKMTSIDCLLKRIITLPNDNHYTDYKKEMIPYLISLGAQVR